MLFIFNGLNSFPHIAENISVGALISLNNMDSIKIDDYTVKFLNDLDNFEIYDKHKRNVYKLSEQFLDKNHDGVTKIFEENQSIFDKAEKLVDELKEKLKKVLNLKVSFLDPFDMEFGKKIDKDVYYSIINEYQNRKFKELVIRGEFSLDILEQLRKDIGPKRVFIYNFVRNPSSHYFTEKKYMEYHAMGSNDTLANHVYSNSLSLINSIVLSEKDFVKTIKIEDVLENGFLEIFDKKIKVNTEEIMHNRYVTQYEYDELISDNFDDTNETVHTFNQRYLNFEITLDEILTSDQKNDFFNDIKTTQSEQELDLINLEYQKKYPNKNFFEELSKGNITKITDILGPIKIGKKIDFDSEKIINFFPVNVFEKLNYSPLTYDEMVN